MSFLIPAESQNSVRRRRRYRWSLFLCTEDGVEDGKAQERHSPPNEVSRFRVMEWISCVCAMQDDSTGGRFHGTTTCSPCNEKTNPCRLMLLSPLNYHRYLSSLFPSVSPSPIRNPRPTTTCTPASSKSHQDCTTSDSARTTGATRTARNESVSTQTRGTTAPLSIKPHANGLT